MNRRLFILALVVLSWSSERDLQAEDGFRVVVNANNPITSLEKAKLERLFLKKESRWADGSKVQPVDRVLALRVGQRGRLGQELLAASAVFGARHPAARTRFGSRRARIRRQERRRHRLRLPRDDSRSGC